MNYQGPTYAFPRLVQIIPARGWRAVFARMEYTGPLDEVTVANLDAEEVIDLYAVAAFGLLEEVIDGAIHTRFVGVEEDPNLTALALDDHEEFVGYVPPGSNAEEWIADAAARIETLRELAQEEEGG